MRKINEIFYSLQGEGYHTGTPAIFVRFSGCNLKCDFCDTQHEEGKMMTDDEIIAEVKKYPAVTVVLTGGEPSLWIDDELIDRLHQAGKYVTIETNGTRPLPAAIDWVTCSPKQGAKLAIDRMDEVKVVYEGQDISIFELLPAEHFFLQPCSCNNTASTVDCVMRHPKWKTASECKEHSERNHKECDCTSKCHSFVCQHPSQCLFVNPFHPTGKGSFFQFLVCLIAS